MAFVIGVVIVFIALSIFLYKDERRRYRERLQAEKDRWGHQKVDDFNFSLIARYSDRNLTPSFHRLSDQTKNDIDFYDLFVVVDRTITRIGQQFLFDKLQRPTDKVGELKRLDATAELFRTDAKLRSDVIETLFPLQHKDNYFTQSLIGKKLIKRPRWFRYLFLSPFVIVALLLIGTKNPVAIICLIVPFVINSIIHFWNKSNTYSFLTSLPQLNNVIGVSKKLNAIAAIRSQEADQCIAALQPFQRKYNLVRFGGDTSPGGDLNVIAYYLVELIKAFTLFEVFVFFNLIKELENTNKSIQTLLNFVADTDIALSVASLRSGALKTCAPDFTTHQKELTMVEGYHPLIKSCVVNTLGIRDKSVLITGSNMSGKTTFLRSMLINSLMAQTVYTCFATSFKTPVLKQYSSIRIQDDIIDGKSLYFQEVNTMKELLRASDEDTRGIFVLDEVFKGTNTVERIAASKAILTYLNKGNNIVLVATHDLELTQLLQSEYDLYHFTEVVENNVLTFDHRIKEGHLRTRNAIRVLELSHYPTEIVVEAKQLSEVLSKTNYQPTP
ncbi:MAG TPA: hypothetical protein VGD40_14845 [Chryseosolibacter sp.]